MQKESSSGRRRKEQAARRLRIAALIACAILLLLIPVRCDQPTAAGTARTRDGGGAAAESKPSPHDARTIGQIIKDEVRGIQGLITLIGLAGEAGSGPQTNRSAIARSEPVLPVQTGMPSAASSIAQDYSNPQTPGTPQAKSPGPGDGKIRLALPL
jgi:hypothetical protein